MDIFLDASSSSLVRNVQASCNVGIFCRSSRTPVTLLMGAHRYVLDGLLHLAVLT